MTIGLMFIGAVILIGIFVLIFVIGAYNALVTLRNRYKNAYSQIDVQLKRRYDLIPNLVETAKGYLQHERGTLEAVITARNAAVSANTRAAQNPGDASAMKGISSAESALSGVMSRLFALAEAYPNLKANETMMSLIEELTSTEKGEHDNDEFDGRTDFDREQSLLRAPGLQRCGDDLQHPPRSFSNQLYREHIQFRAG